jgi:hypothetical protein
VDEGMIVAGPRPCTLRELIETVRQATGSPRYGFRLPLAPMLATAAVVEDVCQALKLDPPIYRRRMDFFTSDFGVRHRPGAAAAGMGAADRVGRRRPAHVRGLPRGRRVVVEPGRSSVTAGRARTFLY